MTSVMLFGAGGHARVVAETCDLLGIEIACYVDPKPVNWLDRPRAASEAEAIGAHPEACFVLGVAGVDPGSLARRADLHARAIALGARALALVHPDASCAGDARISAGAQVFALARLAADAKVGEGAIINTGAIVEHGARVGAFAHVAPGAIVLGDAVVGAGAMIGAGAIVLPGAWIADGAMVKSGTRVPA